jgi:hypothetical protein
MLLLYRILDDVRFKSVESYVDIQYSEYAVVIPGALESYYLKSLIFSEAFDLIVTSYLL